jgi:hypothetical protein
MSTPKAITDTIAALKAERGPLAARLDAIDLAVENLGRVYGLSGRPQPMPTPKARPKATTHKVAAKDDTAAAERREALLTFIAKQEQGATISDLRKHAPRMDGKDRSNALYVLKGLGKIKRAGNAWKAA